jgi:HEAT repeat protein
MKNCRIKLWVAAVLAVTGCGGEARGPLLAGGREVKAWVADLHDPKPAVRRTAVLKLGNVGDDDPAVAGALLEALSDTEMLVRRDAVLAVVKLKQPSDETFDKLRDMSRDDRDPRVREFATKALAKFDRIP